MLENLRIQNFKSWQDTGDIRFGSLTGFFGTNSSGKSSILQFLLMLKQTVESSDRSRILHLGGVKSYVNLRTMYDVLHNHQDPGELVFSFNWKEPEMGYEFGDDFSRMLASITPSSYGFSAVIETRQDIITLKSFAYTKFNSRFIFKIIENEAFSEPHYELNITNLHSLDNEVISGAFRNSANFYGVPNGIYRTHPLLENGLQDVEESFYHFFEQIYYLGPLREYPQSFYSWAGDKPESVGNRGEDAIAAILASRQQGPSIIISDDQPKRTVEEHVAYWLKELGLIYSFVVQPIAPNRKEYEVRIQRTEVVG